MIWKARWRARHIVGAQQILTSLETKCLKWLKTQSLSAGLGPWIWKIPFPPPPFCPALRVCNEEVPHCPTMRQMWENRLFSAGFWVTLRVAPVNQLIPPPLLPLLTHHHPFYSQADLVLSSFTATGSSPDSLSSHLSIPQWVWEDPARMRSSPLCRIESWGYSDYSLFNSSPQELVHGQGLWTWSFVILQIYKMCK